MYSIPTDNLSFRKGCNSNAKRFCCSPKQRTFKRDAYTATYDLDNKLQTFGNKTITYDNDGNMTSGPITEGGNNAALEFNARGQLMGTGDVAYAYDLENTRTIVMHYDKNKILTQYRYVYNRVGNVPEVLMRVKGKAYQYDFPIDLLCLRSGIGIRSKNNTRRAGSCKILPL